MPHSRPIFPAYSLSLPPFPGCLSIRIASWSSALVCHLDTRFSPPFRPNWAARSGIVLALINCHFVGKLSFLSPDSLQTPYGLSQKTMGKVANLAWAWFSFKISIVCPVFRRLPKTWYAASYCTDCGRDAVSVRIVHVVVLVQNPFLSLRRISKYKWETGKYFYAGFFWLDSRGC